MQIKQINLAGSRIATHELEIHLEGKTDDIFIISEQNESYLPILSVQGVNIISCGRSAIVTKQPIIKLWNANMKETTVGMIKTTTSELVIISIYLPPSLTKPEYEKEVEKLGQLLVRHKSKYVVLGGDVNSTHIAWSFKLADQSIRWILLLERARW